MLMLVMLNIFLYFEIEIFILSLNKVMIIWFFLLIKIEEFVLLFKIVYKIGL